MNASRLRTEYLKNPVGIDIVAPRLSWICEGGITQTAFEILAEVNGVEVWHSGIVKTSAMHCIYAGRQLKSRERVIWHIRIWDENEEPGEWSEAFFEMGLLKASDWQAHWITGNYDVDKKRRYPVDCFRTVFIAENIASARLYITACGIYEACLNGKRVGDFVMAPGYTDYKRRIQYQTYDVTQLISEGNNEFTVWLADGWYRGSTGAWGLTNQYGMETKFLCQLELVDKNDQKEVILSDSSWEWSDDGPIRFADNKDGEIVDRRMRPGYGGQARITDCSVVPTASNNVPVMEHEKLKPSVITTPSGKVVLDFGQNIAGFISFRLTAREGQRIFLRLGELIDKDGEFTQKNIQCGNKTKTTPLQQVEYICKDGLNEYKTCFAVFGFQYVLLETDVEWSPDDFIAVAVYSDLERIGYFDSSNSLLNKFVENTVWSAKNNHLDIPTDCPTRERHGWTGDAQIFCTTASWFFDYTAFAKKYLNDIYDWQSSDGCLPQIVPEGGVDSYMNTMNGSVGWADAGVLIPWFLWKHTRDKSILEQYYNGMVRYAAFMQRRCGKKTILSRPLHLSGKERRYAVNYGQSYGEWAEPWDVFPNHWTNMIFPHPEESTAYTAYIMDKMAEIADVLGKADDASHYRTFAAKVKVSYQAMRRLPEFTLDTDRQAQLVRPLYMGLLDPEQTKYAKGRLIRALQNYHWRLGTGFLSTPLILHVLAEYDINAAYRLLENEEIPGWLSMPKNGATTIWEDWGGPNAQTGIASLNHYSKGAVCEWLFDTMCGIRMDGENHFTVEPHPGGKFAHAKASFQSVYGLIESGWTREGERILFTVTIPTNCIALVRLPSGKKYELKTGIYTFEEA